MRRGEESLRVTILRPTVWRAATASKTDNAALQEYREAKLAKAEKKCADRLRRLGKKDAAWKLRLE